MMEEEFIAEEMEPDPELNRWTNAIIGAAIEVHKRLGPGLPEALYENAMAIEFEFRNIPFQRQFRIQVEYRGRLIGSTRLDFIIADKIILEIKSVDALHPVHRAQLI